MKLTKGKLSKLLNKKKQSLKRYKKKGARGNKRRTFRKKNAIYDLSRKTLRQRGGAPNPLDNVSFSEVLQYIGKHLNGKGEVGEEVQDPDQGLEGAAEDQQNAADKEKAEAEAKKKAEEEGLPQGEVEGEVEGEGEGENKGEVEGQGENKGEDEGEDELASQNQDLAPVIEKKEVEGEVEGEKLDDGTKLPGEEETKEEELQQPAAVLANEQGGEASAAVLANEQGGEVLANEQGGEGPVAAAGPVVDEQQTPIQEQEEQEQLATANGEGPVADNTELSTAVESEEELKKKEEQDKGL